MATKMEDENTTNEDSPEMVIYKKLRYRANQAKAEIEDQLETIQEAIDGLTKPEKPQAMKCREWWANDYPSIGIEGVRMHASDEDAVSAAHGTEVGQMRVIEVPTYGQITTAFLKRGLPMNARHLARLALKDLGAIQDEQPGEEDDSGN